MFTLSHHGCHGVLAFQVQAKFVQKSHYVPAFLFVCNSVLPYFHFSEKSQISKKIENYSPHLDSDFGLGEEGGGGTNEKLHC